MLDILYKIYFKIRKKDSKFMLLKKLRTLFVILIRKSINIYAKKYYCYFPLRKNKTGLNTEEMRHTKVIVSLTSFPSRISTIWITIESLLRQTFKPDEIILWLAEEQFDGYDSLPTKLLRLQDKGLKIRFCDDLRSHKKYYYTFQEYPDCIVITVDDDVIYPTNTINALMEIHKKFPDSICCNRGHLIKKTFEKEIAPYNQWVQNPLNFEGPSKLICPTGVSGVLYPPNSINEEVFNKTNIKKLCLYADDLWLKVMALKNNTKAVKTSCFPSELITIDSSQIEALANNNVYNNQNDKQLRLILDNYCVDFSD